MIRKNALNFKLDIDDFSSSAKFAEFMNAFCLEHEQCPSCGARGECHIFAYYNRYIVDISGGNTVTSSLRILRVRCSCGHTHAILPDFLIPYSQYSLAFILYVLRIYFTRSMTVAAICSAFEIASAALYRWINTFARHKSLWLGNLLAGKTPALAFLDSLLQKDLFSAFSNDFFRKTLFSFLQSHANPANCCRAIPGWPSSRQPAT